MAPYRDPENNSAPLDRESRGGRHNYREDQHNKQVPLSATPSTEITDWRPFTSNTMKGLFSCLLPSGLLVHGLSLHVGDDGRAWISLPSKPRVRNGEVSTYQGKPVYDKVIEIPDQTKRETFQTALLAALAEHPEAGRALAGGVRHG